MELPRANWINVRWIGLEFFYWRPRYGRMANAADVRWLGFNVTWRMRWLYSALFQKGWDAGFRVANGWGQPGDTFLKSR